MLFILSQLIIRFLHSTSKLVVTIRYYYCQTFKSVFSHYCYISSNFSLGISSIFPLEFFSVSFILLYTIFPFAVSPLRGLLETIFKIVNFWFPHKTFLLVCLSTRLNPKHFYFYIAIYVLKYIQLFFSCPKLKWKEKNCKD